MNLPSRVTLGSCYVRSEMQQRFGSPAGNHSLQTAVVFHSPQLVASELLNVVDDQLRAVDAVAEERVAE
jgi:hypothetical protein